MTTEQTHRVSRWLLLPVFSSLIVLKHQWNLNRDRIRLDFNIYRNALSYADTFASTTNSLYDYRGTSAHLGFTYPPVSAVALRPLTWFSTYGAEHLWLTITVALSCALCWLATGPEFGVNLKPWRRAIAAAAMVWLVPFALTEHLGQVNVLIASLVVLDLVLVRSKSRYAGIALGLAVAIKLTPAPFILFFWIAKRHDVALRAFGAAVTATLVGLIFYTHDTWRYFTNEVFDTRRVGNLDDAASNSIRRVVEWLPGGNALHTLIWVMCTLVILRVAFRRGVDAYQRGDIGAAFVIISCASFLITPITWSHHLVFAALALPMIATRVRIPFAIVTTLAFGYLLLDPTTQGAGGVWSALRIVALLLVVLRLPIKSAVTTNRSWRAMFDDQIKSRTAHSRFAPN